jgi:hypothetical protein
VIREKAKLPNAHEAARQHVLHEAPEKLQRGDRHRATLTVVRVVLPPKGNALAIKREQAVIADRDTMGIPTEIAQDGGWAAEGRLRIDNPVGAKQRVHKRVPARRVAEGGCRPAEIQLAAGIRAVQPRDEFAAKHPTQDFHR